MPPDRAVVFGAAFPDPVSTPGACALVDGGVGVRKGPTADRVWVYLRGPDGWHLSLDVSRKDASVLSGLLLKYGIKTKKVGHANKKHAVVCGGAGRSKRKKTKRATATRAPVRPTGKRRDRKSVV